MDVTMELLLRLPVKSVFRFKCVCKDWNNLISSDVFRCNYCFRHQNTTLASGFLYQTVAPSNKGPCMPYKAPHMFLNTSGVEFDQDRLQPSLDGLKEFGNSILGSSEGLVLLSRNPMTYYIFDLLTGKQVKLIEPRKKHPYVAVGFICNGHENNIDYKVVRMAQPRVNVKYTRCKTYETETYSSRTRRWRKSVTTFVDPFTFSIHGMAKAIGGVLHWWANGKDIVTYDPHDSSRRAKLIYTPNRYHSMKKISFGAGKDGSLQMIYVYEEIEVWVLRNKDEGGSYLDREEDRIDRDQWSFAHKVGFMDIGFDFFDYGPPLGFSFPLLAGVHPKNPNIMFLWIPNEILSYDQDDSTIQVVHSGPTPYFNDSLFYERPLWPRL